MMGMVSKGNSRGCYKNKQTQSGEGLLRWQPLKIPFRGVDFIPPIVTVNSFYNCLWSHLLRYTVVIKYLIFKYNIASLEMIIKELFNYIKFKMHMEFFCSRIGPLE